MKRIIYLTSIVSLACLLSSCIYLSTKARVQITSTPSDVDAINFKTRVKSHYDSLSKLQKFGNDVFDDDYLNKNISVSYDTLGTHTYNYTEIGLVTGHAKIKNDEWLKYKIKKAAILQGANHIVFTQRLVYDNSKSLWRLISGKNKNPNSPPTVLVKYTGNAVFKK